MEQALQIAMLPTPGMGHLIPHIQLAKRLDQLHNFLVTLIIPTSGPPTKAIKDALAYLPETINYIFLPPVSFDDMPDDINVETEFILTITRSLPSLRDTLRTLSAGARVVALVVDPGGVDAFDVAMELQVPPYVFFPGNAMTLSFWFYLPKLDEMVSCEFRDLPEPVEIPGCWSVPGRDLLDPVQDRSDMPYEWFLRTGKRFSQAKGILINTSMELEEGAVKALLEEPGRPPVYPIGPLIRTGSESSGPEQSECLKWLHNQPRGSVLFVSFGSGGTLSRDQLNELALGLEMSGQRFLWVVRTPNEKSAKGAFFSVHNQNDTFDFLPEGFLDRTKGQGLVVPSWAPQVEVLSHSSTGGFLTHCGWNSVLESIVHGVPLIAWPLYAEQKMNAIMLTKSLNVALRPEVSEKGIIEREEIEKVVKGLLQGEEGKLVRQNMKELKDVAMKVLSEEGSSTKSLSMLGINLKN